MPVGVGWRTFVEPGLSGPLDELHLPSYGGGVTVNPELHAVSLTRGLSPNDTCVTVASGHETCDMMEPEERMTEATQRIWEGGRSE